MEKEVNGNIAQNVELTEINKIIFVLFAEFLGYESPFVKWAEDICEDKEYEDFQLTLVERDADYIFEKMKEEYTLEEIRGWYQEYYDVLLKEYAEKINSKITTVICEK
jgi:hypothetical protein